MYLPSFPQKNPQTKHMSTVEESFTLSTGSKSSVCLWPASVWLFSFLALQHVMSSAQMDCFKGCLTLRNKFGVSKTWTRNVSSHFIFHSIPQCRLSVFQKIKSIVYCKKAHFSFTTLVEPLECDSYLSKILVSSYFAISKQLWGPLWREDTATVSVSLTASIEINKDTKHSF